MKGARTRRLLSFLGLALTSNFQARGDALDTWTNVANSSYGTFDSIVYGNGIFAAGSILPYPGGYSATNGGISSSSDGINWVHKSFLVNITGVAYGNGIFVASGSDPNTSGDGGALYYSTNGSNWAYANAGPPGLSGVTYGNGLFVAVGYVYEAQSPWMGISTNGRDWTNVNISVSVSHIYGATYANGKYLARTDSGPNAILISSDGKNWNSANATVVEPPIPAQPPKYLSGVGRIIFLNGLYFAATASGIYTSPDVQNWTAAVPALPRLPYLLVPQTATNQLFVNAGSAGAIYTSTDATNWTTRVTGITNDLRDIAFGNNHFVTVGTNGAIYLSGNTVPSVAVQNELPAGVQLTISGGLGPTYQLQASSDLTTWSNLVTFTNIGVSTNYLDTTAGNFGQRFYRTVSP